MSHIKNYAGIWRDLASFDGEGESGGGRRRIRGVFDATLSCAQMHIRAPRFRRSNQSIRLDAGKAEISPEAPRRKSPKLISCHCFLRHCVYRRRKEESREVYIRGFVQNSPLSFTHQSTSHQRHDQYSTKLSHLPVALRIKIHPINHPVLVMVEI